MTFEVALELAVRNKWKTFIWKEKKYQTDFQLGSMTYKTLKSLPKGKPHLNGDSPTT